MVKFPLTTINTHPPEWERRHAWHDKSEILCSAGELADSIAIVASYPNIET